MFLKTSRADVLCPSSGDHGAHDDAGADDDADPDHNAGPDHDAGQHNVQRPPGAGQHDRPEPDTGAFFAQAQISRSSAACPQLLGCNS